MKDISGNIWRHYALSAFSITPVGLPILVLFWKQNSLNMLDIYLLQSIYAIIIVLLEVPAGMLSDIWGKKKCIIACILFEILAWLIYALGHSFFAFLMAETVLALAASLLSGADSALIYDTLKALGRELEFKRIEGKAKALQMLAFSVSALLGGFLGGYSYRAAVALSITGPILCLLFVWGFVEVNKSTTKKAPLENLETYKKLLFSSFKFVRKHKLVQWEIMLFALLSGSAGWVLWQYQPYMEMISLPVWAFGAAFALFNLYAAIISNYAFTISNKLGFSKSMILMMFLQVAPLVLMSYFLYPLSFLFILLGQTVRALARPIITDSILKYTYDDKRATVLSINSLAFRFFFAITSPVIGYISEKYTLLASFIAQALFLSIAFTIMIVAYYRIPKKYFIVKD